MVQIEEITTTPTFSSQLENKVLYYHHTSDIAVSYKSTYTLKYVIEGVKQYHYNNQDIEVSKNQYLILNNNSTITTEAKSGAKGLSFFLSQSLIDEIYNYHADDASQLEFLEVIHKKSTSEVSSLLSKAANLYMFDKVSFEQLMESLFIQISEIVVKEQVDIDTKFTALKIVKHNTKNQLFKLITAAKEYLNDHMSEDISLDKISSDIGISKYYLHRLFTELHGYTPLYYLTSIRLEKAKHKLQYSNDSILEIAIACGFDNISYFSNVFKKHIGFSPTQFRSNI